MPRRMSASGSFLDSSKVSSDSPGEPIVTGEYYRLETAAIRTQENVTTA